MGKKITEAQALSVRDLYDNQGKTPTEISKCLNISFQVVYKIVTRQQWRHLDLPPYTIPKDFKLIPDFEDYAINPYGTVIRASHCAQSRAGSIIKPHIHKLGYVVIRLKNEKTRKSFRLHRLVLLTFLGPSPLGINHIDGNKLNNHISNLEYCTQLHNNLHAIRTGLRKR